MGQETDKGVRESGGKQAPETETGDDNGRDSKSYGSPPAKSPDGKTPDGKTPDGTNLVQEETDSKQEHPERDDPDAGDAPPERRPRRRWGWWVAALVFLGLILLVIYHFRSIAEKNEAAAKAKQQQQPGAAITVGQSKTGDINIYVDALGTVTPISTITLDSQITGQVMAVHYQEGQIVNKGDPLVDIDPRPYEATLKQAQGTLQRDQGVLAQARMDLERYRQALERNAIARQQFEDQQHIVVQNEGTVKTDEATVTYDEVQLSYCHIVSPITGRAGLRLVDPGNTVFAGSASTLVVITQLQPITVVFNVSEDELDQVRAQMKGGRSLSVAAYDRSFDKKIESGKLTSLDNQVDTTTGTVKFRAEFSNPTLALYPNQFVNAQLLLKTLSKVTLVPSAAVQQNGTNAFVYVVQPGDKVAVQQVKVLTNDAANTAVQGLNAGVEVATSGFDRLENGVSVSVRGQPGQRNTQSSGSSKSTSANSKGTSAKKSGK